MLQSLLTASFGSITTACKTIDDLITLRLFSAERLDWIEKATIPRIWLSTKGPDQGNVLESLQELFDIISRNMKGSFGAPATHAAQTVSRANPYTP